MSKDKENEVVCNLRKSLARMHEIARLEGRRDAFQEAAMAVADRAAELTGVGAANLLRDMAWDAEQQWRDKVKL